MSDHITNLGILAARADRLAAQLEKQGEKSLAIAQRALADRYRAAITEEIHAVNHQNEEVKPHAA